MELIELIYKRAILQSSQAPPFPSESEIQGCDAGGTRGRELVENGRREWSPRAVWKGWIEGITRAIIACIGGGVCGGECADYDTLQDLAL
jgi:hypothetical protein